MGEKKYRAVLLDLDGTLMDTSEGIFSSIRHATDVLGLPYPDPVTLKTFIGPPIVSSMERVYGMDVHRWMRELMEHWIGGKRGAAGL